MKNGNANVDKSAYDKQYHKDNKTRISNRSKAYYQLHKEEIKERTKKYAKDHHDEALIAKRAYNARNKDKIKESKLQYKFKHPHKIWSQRSFAAHKQKNHTMLFTVDELEELAKNTVRCNICGIELDWYSSKKGTIHNNSPTLDRINNEKVLLLEDVWIVCMRCNVMKNSMTFDEYIEHCRMVVDKFSKR